MNTVMDISIWRVIPFQLYIQARDQGLPTSQESSNRAQVTVNVIRNEHSPMFFESSFDETIRQDAPVGSSLLTLAAQDADTAVITMAT